MDGTALAVACCPPISLGIFYVIRKYINYLRNRAFVRSQEALGWVHIGTVKFMCVYPIEGCCPIETEIAYFGQFGLRTYVDPKASNRTPYYDRGCILFDTSADPAEAILSHTELARTFQKTENLHQFWQNLKANTTALTVGSRAVHITYLNRRMSLFIPGRVVANLYRSTFKLSNRFDAVEIGYFPQDLRKRFNATAKRELLGDPIVHSPYFSSFTMVNSRSIKDLKYATGTLNLSYKNFQPQIVFKGKRPYIEENIERLKIGNLEFNAVNPCTRYEDVALNYEPEGESNSLSFVKWFTSWNAVYPPRDVLRYLAQHRPLDREDPDMPNQNYPTFGISFDFEDGDICRAEDYYENEPDGVGAPLPRNVVMSGYQVFAKYRSRNPHGIGEVAV